MKLPKMILFDYGHTLLYEPGFDFVRGEHALFQYIKTNPDNLSAEEVSAYAASVFEQFSSARSLGIELHERQFQHIVYESLGISFSIGLEEAERIQWDAISPGAVMPDADKMIAYINSTGIRSGVISNIGWSGEALKQRINRLLPHHQFEFVIASSEYGFRKPSPRLFTLALRKAGLPPEDVWFCGDNPQADVDGAAGAGIYPVWYDNAIKQAHTPRQLPVSRHLHIREWTELISLLKKLAAQT